MEPATKQLRPYQVRLVADVCRSTEDALVEQPTGSGKTLQIVALVAMNLGRRFTHAVISAPQEHIEQGFVKRDYQVIAFPACQGVAVPSIRAPKAFIKGARESRLGSVKRVIHYLRQPGPLDHAFACTHATLNRLLPEDLPEDLSGKALFVDEAHHASADGMSEVVTFWRERGGLLFFFTATPYRGDGRPVRLEGMRAFRRSLAEHMAEGFAPRQLESEIVALGQAGDTITAGQFTGEEAPPVSYFDGLAAEICRRWSEGGKPKAIVRVPPMHGGRSGELVGRLLQALYSRGARVLDATGTRAADKRRFLDALESEKTRTYATSAYDVIVGIQRVLEGTDWPVCSAVYCVGMPGSLNTVVQFLGRAMRLKSEDYPAAQRDRAKLLFFVPCAGGTALADLSIDHSRHVLLTCCFLADHEVGQEWIVLREVRRGIEAALGSRADNPAAADAENEADEPLDPEVRAEVELAMASSREQIISNGGDATVGEVVQLATKTRPDLPEAALHRVAVEILASQSGASGEQAREVIHDQVSRKLRIHPLVKQAMEEAFAIVLEEFRGVTLEDSAVLENVGRQIHRVTGGQMGKFAQRLRDAVPRPLTEEQILAWADAHNELSGEWPTISSGAINNVPGEIWANVDAALREGKRGLIGGSSLPRLLADRRGARNKQDLPPLTENRILAWADAHFARTEEWPTRASGPVVDCPGEFWVNVEQALKKGLRGLPADSSLARLLAEHRLVRNVKGLAALTEEQILAWADAYHGCTGEWPGKSSGAITNAVGESWRNVDAALRSGTRGLPGGSSLPRLLAEARGIRNPMARAPLTNAQIVAWGDAHHERTGKWPTKGSGSIDDVPGETWGAVDDALRRGSRGLPGGSSLAQLLADERAIRNRSNLPDLAIEEILGWADAHRQCFGEWPTMSSGQVHQAPLEKWANINAALSQGSRGLPGGTTLARLLAEKRGVQNTAALPLLTVPQILASADQYFERTGRWPTSASGPIEGTNGESWRNVQNALRIGLRGLPGGSSLARLLAEKRGVRNLSALPPLTKEQILAWADAYHDQTGRWPNGTLGAISGTTHETWVNVNQALCKGFRGLPAGSSLAKLLAEERGMRNPSALPRLATEQILQWAGAYFRRTGQWPKRNSGSVEDVPGETWMSIENALRLGLRGLPGGSSLAHLCREHCDKSFS